MNSTLEPIRRVDSRNQLDDVLALPEHLRDALWRVESAGIDTFSATGIVACGMGGSAIGGSLARAALGDRLSRPLTVIRDYELAPWTTPEHAVLCSSYSGNTEETLACFAAAEALGSPRVVATTGGALAAAARVAEVPVVGIPSGLQPRAAVGYMFTIVAELAALVEAAPGLRTEIDGAAAHLEASRDALCRRADEIASLVHGTVPVIYGCDLTGPAAYRWKTQVNENAKVPAFCHELPEMDHNEIVGWEGAGDAAGDGDPAGAPGFTAIFLADRGQHPRKRQRIELTARLIEPHAAAAVEVEAEGETRTARLLWTVMLGDLVSLHLAARRGLDPSPVEVIERLKDALGRP